jgi:putative zinc finger protein
MSTLESHAVGDRLLDYLYDELPPEEREAVEAHLRTCASCAAEVAGLRRVRGAARALALVEPPPEVSVRLLEAAAGRNVLPMAGVAPLATKRARWRWVGHPAWAVAALFVAGVFTTTWFLATNRSVVTSPGSAGGSAPLAPLSPGPPVAPMADDRALAGGAGGTLGPAEPGPAAASPEGTSGHRPKAPPAPPPGAGEREGEVRAVRKSAGLRAPADEVEAGRDAELIASGRGERARERTAQPPAANTGMAAARPAPAAAPPLAAPSPLPPQRAFAEAPPAAAEGAAKTRGRLGQSSIDEQPLATALPTAKREAAGDESKQAVAADAAAAAATPAAPEAAARRDDCARAARYRGMQARDPAHRFTPAERLLMARCLERSGELSQARNEYQALRSDAPELAATIDEALRRLQERAPRAEPAAPAKAAKPKRSSAPPAASRRPD